MATPMVKRLPLHPQRPQPHEKNADDKREGSHLRRHGNKGGNRGGRAFVGVGRPLVERHGGNLEVHSRKQSDQRNPGERVGGRPVAQAFRNDVQFRRAADSVKQRHAIKQQAGGKRAQQEEFHRRFVGPPVAPQEPGQHVLAQGHHFQGDEENDQVDARHHEHHSHGGEKQQGVILPQIRFLNLQIFHGKENDDGRGQDDDQLWRRRRRSRGQNVPSNPR